MALQSHVEVSLGKTIKPEFPHVMCQGVYQFNIRKKRGRYNSGNVGKVNLFSLRTRLDSDRPETGDRVLHVMFPKPNCPVLPACHGNVPFISPAMTLTYVKSDANRPDPASLDKACVDLTLKETFSVSNNAKGT